MICCNLYFIIVLGLVYDAESARILSFNPVPSKSHNRMFKPILDALLKRGHEIVVINADPMYNTGERPENLTEIDIHNVSYSFNRHRMLSRWTKEDCKLQPSQCLRSFFQETRDSFANQIETPEVQQLINDERSKFDLLFLDASSRISIALSHVFQVPIIRLSTTGAIDRYNLVLGVPMHKILYPQCFRQRLYDLTIIEKIQALYAEYLINKVLMETAENEDQILKRLFGPEIPPITELENNMDMLFYGDQPIWEDNRPMPPNTIYIGGVNIIPEQPLPKDIKTYLDDSSQDIIYVSFGGNVNTLDLPPKIIEIFTRSLLNLPYNVCWKWDSDKFPVSAPKIRTFKWLPQADFLRHPKVKLFITHAGLRSTEDAIEAGVPVIGVPLFMDQFFNSEKYVRHGIGIKLDASTLTEQQLTAAINTIMTNKSYEQNVIRLRKIMKDQPMTPLENAVWWTEYVLRHGGARHLRPAAAGVGWVEYYELKLLLIVLFTTITTVVLIVVCIYVSIKFITKRNRPKRKVF